MHINLDHKFDLCCSIPNQALLVHLENQFYGRLKILLWFLMDRNKKKFNKTLEKKNVLITEINNQNQNLQNKIADYERLQSEIAKDKREERIEEINVDKNVGGVPSVGIEYIPYPTARTVTFGINVSL